jgi:hypothetical protein
MVWGVQRKVRQILSVSSRDEREEKLRKLAQSLGGTLQSTYKAGPLHKHLEDEVIRRIQEAARESRDSALWWVAVLSAAASVISAFAAWVAIGKVP